MLRLKSRLLIAVLTFVIGVLGVSLWFLRNGQATDSSKNNNGENCAIILTNKFNNSDDKAYVLAEIAQLYTNAGHKELAQNLLSQSLKVTKTIEKPLNQAGAIWRISDSGDVEHLEQALLIARGIKDTELHFRIWAYREIAENFIRLEMPDRAKSVLDEAVLHLRSLRYQEAGEKELDLSFIGQLYAKSGYCQLALQSAKGFKNKARIEEVKRETAKCFASTKQPESAFTVAESIKVYKEMQVDAFLGIAAIFAKNNNDVLTDKALENALQVVRQKDWSDYDDQQALAYAKIAKVYLSIGNNKEASKILEKAESVASSITNPNFKIPALARVSEGFAELSSFDKALRIATSLKEPSALAKIANRLFKVGDKAKAQELLKQAQEMPYQTSNSLMEIAEIYAANGLQQQSLELIEQVKKDYSFRPTNESYEDSFVEKIISSYLKLKEYDLALKTALELKDPRHRVLALTSVEIEMDKTKASINEENRNLLSQIGCISN